MRGWLVKKFPDRFKDNLVLEEFMNKPPMTDADRTSLGAHYEGARVQFKEKLKGQTGKISTLLVSMAWGSRGIGLFQTALHNCGTFTILSWCCNRECSCKHQAVLLLMLARASRLLQRHTAP